MASHLNIQEREVISQMRYGRRKAAGSLGGWGGIEAQSTGNWPAIATAEVIRPCAPSGTRTSAVAIDRWCARWTSSGSAGKSAKV